MPEKPPVGVQWFIFFQMRKKKKKARSESTSRCSNVYWLSSIILQGTGTVQKMILQKINFFIDQIFFRNKKSMSQEMSSIFKNIGDQIALKKEKEKSFYQPLYRALFFDWIAFIHFFVNSKLCFRKLAKIMKLFFFFRGERQVAITQKEA